MDEIDAALDFKNVSIVGNYIKVKIVLYPFLSLLYHFNKTRVYLICFVY